MFEPHAIARQEDGRYSVTADLPGEPAAELAFEIGQSSDGGIVAVSIPDRVRAATGPDTRPARPLFDAVADFHRAAAGAGPVRLRDVRVDGPSSYAGTVLAPGTDAVAVVFTADASGAVQPPGELRRIAGPDGAGVERVLAAVASFHRARWGIPTEPQ
jgi:hypothetical protein